MGGVMFILPVVLITTMLNAVALLGGNFDILGKTVLVPLITMLGFGFLGQLMIGRVFVDQTRTRHACENKIHAADFLAFISHTP